MYRRSEGVLEVLLARWAVLGYYRSRLGAVFRESLPNDGGRSKLTFAVHLRERPVYLET